jgi:hypothetical protein
LLTAVATPLMIAPASAGEAMMSAAFTTDGSWVYIQNDVITMPFPTGGEKPMSLWWHTKDPEIVNVVKFKGLIEYCTYEKPYFLWRCRAEA